MLVIGIDPGTATTGYGLVRENRDGSLQAVAYGVVKTPAAEPMSLRLRMLFDQLNEIISLHQPDIGAVENLFFQTNVKTAISVGQGRGVAILSLAMANLEVTEYTPLQVKQAVVGYGKADKRQVQEMVRTLLGLADIPRPDDAADALAVAICHIHNANMQQITKQIV